MKIKDYNVLLSFYLYLQDNPCLEDNSCLEDNPYLEDNSCLQDNDSYPLSNLIQTSKKRMTLIET
jgi:hypothetical protein